MRPARKGPENKRDPRSELLSAGRFNEAGPQGAGKPARPRQPTATAACFNEAGPQGAGKHSFRESLERRRKGASMRPARKGPENVAPRPQDPGRRRASMRPARKGPENVKGVEDEFSTTIPLQ